MAHYAKLGMNNVVLGVVYIDTIKCVTKGGIEKESIGADYLRKVHGHETWVKCSYNTVGGVHIDGGTAFRANFPAAGWTYDSTNDIFYPPKPLDMNGVVCDSWTLNTTSGLWEPPITKPDEGGSGAQRPSKQWDEAAYQADNTAGWVTVSFPS